MESRNLKDLNDGKRKLRVSSSADDKITDPDFDELDYFLKKQEEEIRAASIIDSKAKSKFTKFPAK